MMSLEDRMKGYEEAARTRLTRRLPLIIRVDGKGFSRYTKRLEKPFDRKFIHAMEHVATALCYEIQGAELAYAQSDEVSVLVHGYKKHESTPWFDNQVQKMVSVSAAVASATFTANSYLMFGSGGSSTIDDIEPAYFDARVFALPEAEVANYFIWRQQDAMRNSVQMFASAFFSHKELHGKNVVTMKEMCHDAGHDYDALTPSIRKGRCVKRRHTETLNPDGTMCLRSHWEVDTDIPIFSASRDYIEDHLDVEEK